MVRCSAAEYNCSHYLHNILRESPGGPAEQGRAHDRCGSARETKYYIIVEGFYMSVGPS